MTRGSSAAQDLDLEPRPALVRPATQIWLCCAVFVLVSLSLSSSSLWIDEGFSAYLASIQNFRSFLQVLRSCDSGDLQTGGYYVYLWLWAHVFGSRELALRASNLPFLALLCFSFYWTSHHCFHGARIWPVCVLSPFIFVYLNEARVYLPVLACSCMCVAGFLVGVSGARARASSIAPFLCIGFLACASLFNLLAILLYPALFLLGLNYGLIRSRVWIRSACTFLPILLLEGGYYAWTFLQKQDMTYDVFRPSYLLLWTYEFLGLQGIGPGRNQLRLLNHDYLKNEELLIALLIGICMGLLLINDYLRSSSSAKQLSGRLVTAGTFSLACTFVLSYLLNERFLPRHGAAIYPLFLFALLALLAAPEPRKRPTFATALLVCVTAIWVISDIRVRFLQQYQKEDYRSAVARAMLFSKGNEVRLVWAADIMTAAYYGLQLENPFNVPFGRVNLKEIFPRTGWRILGRGLYGSNLHQDQVLKVLQQSKEKRQPIVMALSKPDLYDQYHSWNSVLVKSGGQSPANINSFAFYEINPDSVLPTVF